MSVATDLYNKPNNNLRGDLEGVIDDIINRLGKDLRVGIGAGVGKPVKFINALFDRAVKDPEIKLTIISALSLEKPLPGNELQNI